MGCIVAPSRAGPARGLWATLAPGPDTPASVWAQELREEANGHARAAYAASTEATYGRHQKYYVTFMLALDFAAYMWAPLEAHLVLYVTFLARTCSFNTIKGYLQGVRVFYLERGLPNPLEDAPQLARALKGIRRTRGDAVKRKLAIDPVMLRQWLGLLDVQRDDGDLVLITAMVIDFYGFFRKSNIAVAGRAAADDTKVIRREDISVDLESYCLWVRVRWSKTIQFQERELRVPIAGVPGDPLDPVALWLAVCQRVSAAPSAHAFSYPSRKGGPLVPLTHAVFVRRTKQLASRIGIDERSISGHSFRRGGATYAFSVGVSGELIKCQGDWKSHVYLIYLDMSDQQRLSVTRLMQAAIAQDLASVVQSRAS